MNNLETLFKKLEQLVAWNDYYHQQHNPIEANKVQKEIEQLKKTITEIKNGQTKSVSQKGQHN
jgi:hypothetical protein